MLLFPRQCNKLSVTYWPSTEPLIKRCTCVNKRKFSGSRWTRDNYIIRCQRQLESVGDKMPKWEPVGHWGLCALSDPRLNNPRQDEKESLLWSEELGSICSSLSPSPAHVSHTTNINPSRVKCERYIFIKKCVRSFIEVVIIVDYVSAYILICMWLYNISTKISSQ